MIVSINVFFLVLAVVCILALGIWIGYYFGSKAETLKQAIDSATTRLDTLEKTEVQPIENTAKAEVSKVESEVKSVEEKVSSDIQSIEGVIKII